MIHEYCKNCLVYQNLVAVMGENEAEKIHNDVCSGRTGQCKPRTKDSKLEAA